MPRRSALLPRLRPPAARPWPDRRRPATSLAPGAVSRLLPCAWPPLHPGPPNPAASPCCPSLPLGCSFRAHSRTGVCCARPAQPSSTGQPWPLVLDPETRRCSRAAGRHVGVAFVHVARQEADEGKTASQMNLAIERQWSQNLVQEIEAERAKLAQVTPCCPRVQGAEFLRAIRGGRA